MDSENELRVVKKGKDKKSGVSHARYRQYYKSIPIWGKQVVATLKNKKQKVRGTIMEDINIPDVQPSFDSAGALTLMKADHEGKSDDSVFVYTTQKEAADVNNDGKITIHDAKLIANYVSGNIPELPYNLIIGDVNLNGIVTSVDSLYVLYYINNYIELTQIPQIAADADCNDQITEYDADLIAQYVGGNVSALPQCE